MCVRECVCVYLGEKRHVHFLKGHEIICAHKNMVSFFISLAIRLTKTVKYSSTTEHDRMIKIADTYTYEIQLRYFNFTKNATKFDFIFNKSCINRNAVKVVKW